jgi:lysophospholipase L1-like esterase
MFSLNRFLNSRHSFLAPLLFVVSVLASLAIAEIVVRVALPAELHVRTFRIGERQALWAGSPLASEFKNGFATYKLCYDLTYRVEGGDADNCIAHTVNSSNFREEKPFIAKPDNVFRVTVIGDSFTEGEGVTAPQSFVSLIPSKLPSYRGKRVESYNLGLGGAGTLDEQQVYRNTAKTLSPDLVILQWNTNDFPSSAVSKEHSRLITGDYGSIAYPPAWMKWSALLRLIRNTWFTHRVSNDLIELSETELREGAHNFSEVASLADEVINGGRQFLLVIFPEIIRLDDYPYAGILKAFEANLKLHKIGYINLLPEISAFQDRQLWVHPSDHHPNSIAHQIAASMITDYLNSH